MNEKYEDQRINPPLYLSRFAAWFTFFVLGVIMTLAETMSIFLTCGGVGTNA